jgi:hypothetical protein
MRDVWLLFLFVCFFAALYIWTCLSAHRSLRKQAFLPQIARRWNAKMTAQDIFKNQEVKVNVNRFFRPQICLPGALSEGRRRERSLFNTKPLRLTVFWFKVIKRLLRFSQTEKNQIGFEISTHIFAPHVQEYTIGQLPVCCEGVEASLIAFEQ